MTKLPDPLTPADSDLSDFSFMPLEVGRFRRSDLVTQAEPEAVVAAVLLWGAAWHSTPSASLSNDDRSLAQAAGYGRAVAAFRSIKEVALHGFILCSDGRLYHPVVAEKALEAWEAKLKRLWRTECARIRKANERGRDADDHVDEQAPSFEDWRETRYNAPSRVTIGTVTRDNTPLSHATTDECHAIVTRDNVERGGGEPDLDSFPSLDDEAEIQKAAQEHEQEAMSHATAPVVTRDTGVDSCARAEKVQGQGQGQGDSNRLRSTTSIDDDAEKSTSKPKEENPPLLDLVDRLAQAAGLNVTVPKQLSSAIDTLKQWLEDGIDFESTIVPTIEARTSDNPSEPVYSLRYFDAAVRKAHAVRSVKAKAPPEPERRPLPPKAPIGMSDDEDHRVGRFRARLEYAVGAKRYADRFGPDLIAVKISDNRLLDVYFRDEPERSLIRSGDEQHMSSIARGLGLSFRDMVAKP